MELRTDCLYFRGSKPCVFTRLCGGCGHYRPAGVRILIIKLASIGDVLRTTPLLRALKKKFPRSYIVWLSAPESLPVLRNNVYINELLPLDLASVLRLQVEKYDLVMSLDKASEAAACATLVRAERKFGYGLGPDGRILPFNKEAEYGFALGLSDELKFRQNRRSYQDIIFETCGLRFNNEEYILRLDKEALDFRNKFMARNGLNRRIPKIGLNTGCGKVFPYKKWPRDNFVKLARKLLRSGMSVLVLGGREEEENNEYILREAGEGLIDTGCRNSIEEFSSIISCCDLLVTGDTMALHISLALRKKVVALFGPTCAQEVEMYGRGAKLVSKAGCAPCYKQHCGKNGICMDDITPDGVLKAVKRLLLVRKRCIR